MWRDFYNRFLGHFSGPKALAQATEQNRLERFFTFADFQRSAERCGRQLLDNGKRSSGGPMSVANHGRKGLPASTAAQAAASAGTIAPCAASVSRTMRSPGLACLEPSAP